MALTTFGAKLRKWRDENELTRRELSEMIYFSENAIRGWETGGTPPSYDAMIAVADCMGVSLDWLKIWLAVNGTRQVKLLRIRCRIPLICWKSLLKG